MTASRYNVPEADLATYLVEDRRASLSPWGRGNSKLGSGIYTYSKLPVDSCPGASAECLSVCYTRKLDPLRTRQNHPVWQLWNENTNRGDELPPLPADAKIVRIHVSGDFDTIGYIDAWRRMVTEHRDVTFFGYTRSWRVPHLRWPLGLLTTQPNIFLWASIDKSIGELPDGWPRAWIEGDERLTKVTDKTYRTFDGRKAIVCPEATGLMPNCQTCRFCFLPHNMDLVFPLH